MDSAKSGDERVMGLDSGNGGKFCFVFFVVVEEA